MNILTSRLPALKFIAMFGAAHLGFSLLSNVTFLYIEYSQQVKAYCQCNNTCRRTYNRRHNSQW